LYCVLNKMRTTGDEQALPGEGLDEIRPLGTIPFDTRFIDADCKGVSVFARPGSEDLWSNFEGIVDRLVFFCGRTAS
jgi:hypothetical protein